MAEPEWTEAALADRDLIFDYMERDNPRAAAMLDARFSDCAARLQRHPRLGRPGRVQDTREFIAHPNYILVYEISDDETVRILRVVHSARWWPVT